MSFLRNDFTKWVEMFVRPSVNVYDFCISSLITESTILKLHKMVPDIGSHNGSVTGFFDFRSRDPKMRSKSARHFSTSFFTGPTILKHQMVIEDIGT